MIVLCNERAPINCSLTLQKSPSVLRDFGQSTRHRQPYGLDGHTMRLIDVYSRRDRSIEVATATSTDDDEVKHGSGTKARDSLDRTHRHRPRRQQAPSAMAIDVGRGQARMGGRPAERTAQIQPRTRPTCRAHRPAGGRSGRHCIAGCGDDL